MLTQNLTKLVIVFPKEPFQKWGLYFIIPVKVASKNVRKPVYSGGWKHKHSTPTLCNDHQIFV
jgi:hypothetical protein